MRINSEKLYPSWYENMLREGRFRKFHLLHPELHTLLLLWRLSTRKNVGQNITLSLDSKTENRIQKGWDSKNR